MIKCPNINHSDWKAIEAKYGEDTAWAAYRLWGEEIPSLAEVDNYIKTFGDTNSELPNSNIGNNQYQVEQGGDALEIAGMGYLSNVLQTLSTKFNIPFEIINDPNAGFKGYVDNESSDSPKIVVNAAKATHDTPLHEYAHIFISMIRQSNKNLYSNLIKEVNSTKEGRNELEKIKKYYKDYTEEEQVEEAIVQMIGKLASYELDPSTGFHKSVKKIWDTIVDFIAKAFNVRMSNIPPNVNMEYLGKLLAMPNVNFNMPHYSEKYIEMVSSEAKRNLARYTKTLDLIQNTIVEPSLENIKEGVYLVVNQKEYREYNSNVVKFLQESKNYLETKLMADVLEIKRILGDTGNVHNFDLSNYPLLERVLPLINRFKNSTALATIFDSIDEGNTADLLSSKLGFLLSEDFSKMVSDNLRDAYTGYGILPRLGLPAPQSYRYIYYGRNEPTIESIVSEIQDNIMNLQGVVDNPKISENFLNRKITFEVDNDTYNVSGTLRNKNIEISFSSKTHGMSDVNQGMFFKVLPKVINAVSEMYSDMDFDTISFVPVAGESAKGSDLRLKGYNIFAKRLFGKYSLIAEKDNSRVIPIPEMFKNRINEGKNQYQVDRNSNNNNNIKTAPKPTEVKDEQVVSNVVDAITKQLEAMGIGIGVLEDYQNVNGVFDPNGAKDLATGLINLIKVAKGEKGRQAIPEEFAHFVDLVLKQQNSPLYGRLNNLLNSEKIIKEVFEREEVGSYAIYKSLYQNDPEALRAEARGKLLARHIIRGEQIKQPLLAPLLQRLKNLFNRIFGKGNTNQLASDLYKADVEYSKIALKIMDGSIDLNFNIDSIRGNRVLYNAQSSLDSSKKALKAIIDLRAKQLQINKDFLSKDQIDALEGDISSLTYQYGKDTEIIDGIINGIQKALDDFKELQLETTSFKVDMSEGSDQAMKVSRHLRKIKSYVNAYTPLVSGLIDYTNSTEFKAMGVDAIKDSVNELLVVINTANSEYFRNSQPLFLEFIKQYSKGLIGSEWKGEIFTEEMFNRLIFEASKDIGIAERWLYSMSNTSDIMLGLIEQPVKEATWKQMQEVNEIVRTMQGAQEKLEKAGYKTDFIYEVDSKGIPTGYLLQPIDNARFREDKEKKKAELIKKWGHPVDSNPNRHTYWQMLHRWERANTENDGTPNKIKYASKAYNNMNTAQREFYNTILAEKEKAMKALPERRQDLFLAPQVRKDQMESIKDSRNLTDAWNRMTSALGDRWLVRDTDDVFGETITGEENGKKYVLKGFDGREIEKIPIYYSKKMDDTANLSLDIVSSMTLYVDMATRYKYMNEIVDIMEIGRDIMREKRQISQTKGGKELQEKIQTAGRTISNKVFKPKDASLFMDRLNDFYSAQIYGVSQKDEGSFKVLGKDVSWAKLANEVNKLTALNTYAVNTLGAVANVATGLAQNRLETIAGEHLGIKESAKADRVYAKWLPQILGDLGRRRDTSLPSLLMQKFNVHQDYDQAIRGLEMNRKNLLSRIFTGSSVFFMNNAGEHYLAAKVFIAMSERVKLKDKLGKSVSLINAFEVRKDASGIERLYLKEGIVKQDGSEFTDKDIMNFSRKVAKVHQDLHGIYNREDMTAFQKLAIGRMIFMFRKWMPPAFGRRIDKAKYNFDLEQYQEGFYRTSGRFLKSLYNDLRQGQINMAMHWDSLSSHEKSNIYRALTEVGYLIAVVGAYALLSTAWEDDDEWIKDFTLYQIRRQQAEVGTMVPIIYTQFSEGLNIIQSPAAAMDYSQHLINVLRVWDIWKDPIASGTYEGWNPYMRDLVRPLPYHNAIRRTLYPKESIKAFTL